jgi:hypothetical protein
MEPLVYDWTIFEHAAGRLAKKMVQSLFELPIIRVNAIPALYHLSFLSIQPVSLIVFR